MTEITYEKTIDKKGQRGIKIIKIKNAKPVNELPDKYMNGKPRYCKIFHLLSDKEGIEVIDKMGEEIDIYEGDILSAEEFEYIISLMKQAGKRLLRIKAELREESEGWSGRGIIKI